MTFVATRTNMVQQVLNTIQGYRLGPLRALAQDPPQNSLDAGVGRSVTVEYVLRPRIHDGKRMTVLTVTDSGTCGLNGPILTDDQIEERTFDGGAGLRPGENWAAWEAMGYTKEGEDSLGSRGQGKAAFLYHSEHTLPGSNSDQMIMLYDTLTTEGEYRLGVRRANPADVRLDPPFLGDDARAIVSGNWVEGPYDIPLDLMPLEEAGSRIIVPFLRQGTLEAFESGEMIRWLERQWWRAIQIGELRISVGWEGEEPKEISVPDWWQSEPWQGDVGQGCHIREHIELESGLQIKRVVLFHDPNLSEDELSFEQPEYAGVQLLRKRQWIETLGSASEFGDLVPSDARPGFRGFVEFDRQLDQRLRVAEIETPQHDRFHRKPVVKQIIEAVREEVKVYAIDRGWYEPEDIEAPSTDTANDVLSTLSGLFVPSGPGEGGSSGESWRAALNVNYPTSGTTRVDWGQSLTGISAELENGPSTDRIEVRATLSVITPDGGREKIASRTRKTTDGGTVIDFDPLNAVARKSSRNDHAFPVAGRYRLRVDWDLEGKRIASASRALHVRVEPPIVPVRPVSVTLKAGVGPDLVVHASNGDRVRVRATLRNRSTESSVSALDCSLEDLVIWREKESRLDGVAKGDEPNTHIVESVFRVFDEQPGEDVQESHVVLAPGRYSVELDAAILSTGQVLHATAPLLFEVDEEEGGNHTPFNIKAWAEKSATHPEWELRSPPSGTGNWDLYYSPHHPTYEAAKDAEKKRTRRVSAFFGERGYWTRIITNALVEQASTQYIDFGDEGALDRLLDRTDEDDELWQSLEAAMNELKNASGEPLRLVAAQRRVASAMQLLSDRESS